MKANIYRFDPFRPELNNRVLVETLTAHSFKLGYTYLSTADGRFLLTGHDKENRDIRRVEYQFVNHTVDFSED